MVEDRSIIIAYNIINDQLILYKLITNRFEVITLENNIHNATIKLENNAYIDKYKNMHIKLIKHNVIIPNINSEYEAYTVIYKSRKENKYILSNKFGVIFESEIDKSMKFTNAIHTNKGVRLIGERIQLIPLETQIHLDMYNFNKRAEIVDVCKLDCIITYKFNIGDEIEEVKLTQSIEQKERLLVPKFITTIQSVAFQNSTKIKYVDMSNNLSSIGGQAFRDCTNLEEVTIGSGLVTLGNYAFYNCRKLKKITINSDKIDYIGISAFENCISLKQVILKSKTKIKQSAFNNCKEAVFIINNKKYNLTEIKSMYI